MSYNKIWKLDTLLEGKNLEEVLALLKHRVEACIFEPYSAEFYLNLQDIHAYIREAGSLIGCLTAQDTNDAKALLYESRIQDIATSLGSIEVDLENFLKQMSDEEFSKLFSNEKLADIRFYFEEMRSFAKKKLSQKEEKLINDLSSSGHDIFTSMYYAYMGEISFSFRGEKLTLGQLENKLSEKDRSIRVDAMHSLENHLKEKENLFCQFLTSIVDFRNTLYHHRGWENPLEEALHTNRIEQKTIDTMWRVVEKNKPALVKFMRKKAEIMGLDQLSWADYDAPLQTDISKKLDYDNGIDFIVKQFGKISPRLAAFSKRAADERWIEADNRKGKRAGGFCTDCPVSKESRIFMNYVPTMGSLATLAHELGHAYHNEVLYEKPLFSQQIGMAIAETASTMCEMIVTDGAIREAKSEEEKLSLLDDKLSKALSFSCDLHARYIFDKQLHERRKQGPLSPEDLTEMMIEAQKIGFDGSLSDYLPHFWAYKMHFYFTDISFYNFPYTVGYLFSLGIYHHLMKDPQNFEHRYDAILLDSGCMTMEELAKKHLNVNLGEEQFWQGAYDVIKEDVKMYVKLGA
ncbi:MAG: M3 family oligoendopeptidase [Chlamydiae bacterium]|nr:M3 family oligoendopeptidase [Chlamydiota bacterium]